MLRHRSISLMGFSSTRIALATSLLSGKVSLLLLLLPPSALHGEGTGSGSSTSSWNPRGLKPLLSFPRAACTICPRSEKSSFFFVSAHGAASGVSGACSVAFVTLIRRRLLRISALSNSRDIGRAMSGSSVTRGPSHFSEAFSSTISFSLPPPSFTVASDVKGEIRSNRGVSGAEGDTTLSFCSSAFFCRILVAGCLQVLVTSSPPPSPS
mmetsp:Transcript_12010/g.19611  ORF Transcript_12010/g.19611 Transcript_12010/m.19611 type:complete len:210 (-) Transcript_12010:1649-2278(-)